MTLPGLAVSDPSLMKMRRISMTTTNEIADKLATEHGLSKVQGKAVVEAVIAAITEAAIAGNETSLPGFGKFKIKDTPERERAIRRLARRSRSRLPRSWRSRQPRR
jgi:nucleoid DNA-binding protein